MRSKSINKFCARCISALVERKSYISLLDRSSSRRAGVCHRLMLEGLHIEPFEDVSEFMMVGPPKGLILVHDEDALLVPLSEAVARGQCSYPYVVYSESPQWQRAVSALQSGARTYVSFPDQIKMVASFWADASEEVLSIARHSAQKETAKNLMTSLTPREVEILRGVISGHTSRLIADNLGVSHRTVEDHRSNISRKLGARNGADLVRIAADADFLVATNTGKIGRLHPFTGPCQSKRT